MSGVGERGSIGYVCVIKGRVVFEDISLSCLTIEIDYHGRVGRICSNQNQDSICF